MTKPLSPTKIAKMEKESVHRLRSIQWDIDSNDPVKMYEAISSMASTEVTWILLPKAMDLLKHKEKNVQHASFTLAAGTAYGPYVPDLFRAMSALNPAEREQILQSIQERFVTLGGPQATSEQKLWVGELENLGREHQPSVFSMMRFLGSPGKRWVTKQVKDNIKTISLGAVPTIAGFSERDRKRLLKILAEGASKNRRELLPYICGIIDAGSVKILSVFMKGSTWQERVEIAGALARNGIRTASGLLMQLVGDSNWQVKQALLENLSIETSKLTSLLRMLSFLVTETHSRVRSLAERTLLLLGQKKCSGSKIKDQRARLEKQFRPQLLKAANANKDIDVEWLGIERKTLDPMSEILEKVSSDEEASQIDDDLAQPQGVSLLDLAKPEPVKQASDPTDDKSTLLAALLDAKKAKTETKPSSAVSPDASPSKRFITMLQSLARKKGEGVSMETLMEKAEDYSLSQEELFMTMAELEKQGIIYRSDKGLVSYAGFDM